MNASPTRRGSCPASVPLLLVVALWTLVPGSVPIRAGGSGAVQVLTGRIELGTASFCTIAGVVMMTVVLSVVLHGASAIPLVTRYSRRTGHFEAGAPENRPVVEMPIHLEWSHRAERIEEQISAWEARIRHR